MMKLGPKTYDHPSVGDICQACHKPFRKNDYTVLVPLGPGGDEDAREKMKAGKSYNAIAIEIHYDCADHTKTY